MNLTDSDDWKWIIGLSGLTKYPTVSVVDAGVSSSSGAVECCNQSRPGLASVTTPICKALLRAFSGDSAIDWPRMAKTWPRLTRCGQTHRRWSNDLSTDLKRYCACSARQCIVGEFIHWTMMQPMRRRFSTISPLKLGWSQRDLYGGMCLETTSHGTSQRMWRSSRSKRPRAMHRNIARR